MLQWETGHLEVPESPSSGSALHRGFSEEDELWRSTCKS